MTINIRKNVIDKILEQLETAKATTNTNYTLNEAKDILSRYQRNSLEFLPFAKDIENFSVRTFENGNELIQAKLVYRSDMVPYTENDITIIKHHKRPVLELVKYTDYLSVHKAKKEISYVPTGTMVEKDSYEFWKDGFHLSNFSTYKRCDSHKTVAEKFQKGFTLTQAPSFTTGEPFQGSIELTYKDDKVKARATSGAGRTTLCDANLVSEDIKDEYRTLLNELGREITTGKVKKLGEMKY